MRVLVTGNAGYLGPVIVRRLKAAGHRVWGLDLGWFLPQYASLPEWVHEQRFADIRDPFVYDPRANDAIVHLAGLSNDPLGDLDPKWTESINAGGTLHMLRVGSARRNVVVSSCAVYGANPRVAYEKTPTHPLTAYAMAKDMVDDLAPLTAKNTVSLRLGTVYGPSPGHRLDLVVNRMVYKAQVGQGVTVSGNSWRPFVHIEDVAEAVLRAVESDFTGIRNVVGENMQIDALGELVASTMKAQLHREDSPDKRDYRATTLYPDWMEYRHNIADTIPDLARFSLTLPGNPSRYERLATIKNLIKAGRLTADLKEPIAA